MKYIIILAFVAMFTLPVYSQEQEAQEQDTLWYYRLKTGITFSQTSFSENWTGGGVGSIALNGYLTATTLYTKGKTTWRNQLQLQYGIIDSEDQDLRKTIDRIFLDSKLGHEISSKWNLYSSLSFFTQFAPGYRFNDDGTRDKISDFMAPAFLTSSWGFEYVPNDWFWLRIGPFSPRLTFVTDEDIYLNVPENYGVPIGETVREEWLAFQFTAELDKDLGDNLNIKARYNLFANYEELSGDKIDHFLEVLATSQVTKFIDVSFGVNLIYDFDQIDEVQLSQLFGVGLLLNVGTLEEK